MNYEVKELPGSEVEITISVEGAEAKKYFDGALNRVAGKANIPGFRKGKAPASVIAEKFEKEIKEEVAEEFIGRNYPGIVKEKGLKVVEMPRIYEFNATEEKISVLLKVDVYPAVKLGQYKGLEVAKEKFEVTKEHIDAEIAKLAEKSGVMKEVADAEKAKDGDTVTINFEGFVDGVAFSGGKAENYELKLGSHSFIDTFEEQIIGHIKGDEFDVNVKFPEEYHQANLAGKPSVFKVRVNAIKRMETPELNDEFAKDVGYDNLESLTEAKKIEIEQKEKTKVERGYVNAILEKIQAGSELEIPNALVKKEAEMRIKEMEAQLGQQGMTLENYLKMTGMTMDKLMTDIMPMASDKIRMDIIIDEIAKYEEIKVTEEEVEEKIAEVSKYYGMEVDKLKSELKKVGNYDVFVENLKLEKITQKTIDLIISETIEK